MRRYVLGRQGLWPGRRVADKPGVAQIIRQIGAVQLDPIDVVARSHDIVLWGRVAGYQPSQLDELLYSNRQFFDYGGGLEVYHRAAGAIGSGARDDCRCIVMS